MLFFPSVQHVDVYRLVLVGIEVEYESEVFEYLWHNLQALIVFAAKIQKSFGYPIQNCIFLILRPDKIQRIPFDDERIAFDN